MGKTRSMNRKKKHDDACSKINTIKTCDKSSGETSWSDLTHDVLILVMMQLGFVDFLAFSGVCKSWRSFATSNKNKFMVSKPPMSISVSAYNPNEKQECYIEDFKGKKFKITPPHFAGRTCVGVTCGYLILYGEETNDFWFVNLVTSHELHFPDLPSEFYCCPGRFRSILVFSPSISGWVFVVFEKCYFTLWFCIAGKGEWTQVSTPSYIDDLLAFKGKIYTLHSDEVRLCEMRFFPEPKLVLLEIENFPNPDLGRLRYVSSSENLYVIDPWDSEHPYKIHELDFGEMKWVSRENTGEKYAFFRNDFNDWQTFTLREVWADIHSQYGRYFVADEYGNGAGLFEAEMWYFLDECLNVNLLHE